MRGWTLVISFISFMRFHINSITLWSPWPITWNLTVNESKKEDIQPIVHIYLNCSCKHTKQCTPLIRHGYTFIKQIDKRYQEKLCYNKEQSVVCRRNKTMSRKSKWLLKALNDLKNTTMIKCLKSVLKNTEFQTKEKIRSETKNYQKKIQEDPFGNGTALRTSVEPLLGVLFCCCRILRNFRSSFTELPQVTRRNFPKHSMEVPVSCLTFKEERNGTNDTITQLSTLVPGNILQDKETNKLHSFAKEAKREQRSSLFAALIISLALANTLFLVLLAICLILYFNVKPKDEKSTNAKAGSSKLSSMKRRKRKSGKRGEEHLTKTSYDKENLARSRTKTLHVKDKRKMKKDTGIELTVVKPDKFSAPSNQINDQDLQTALQCSPEMNNVNIYPSTGSIAPRSTVLQVVPKQSLQMPAKSSSVGVEHSPVPHLPWFSPRRERSVFASGNLQSEHAFQ